VSLARALSKLGIASRAQAAVLIAHGRVQVDRRVVRDPEAWIDLRTQRVEVDGAHARAAAKLYVLLHKPAGYVTTRSDERGRSTVYDLLPAGTPWVFPVGRLDRETTGALLLTNDTRLGDAVTDPAFHLAKEYHVLLDRPLEAADRVRMEGGMALRDGTHLLPAKVQGRAGAVTVRITLREGKNRQVRRMCEELGYAVVHLHRAAIGPLRLTGIGPGSLRRLTGEEVDALFGAAQKGRSS
jgi:23S rRNA pseudouridine2605 synthase